MFVAELQRKGTKFVWQKLVRKLDWPAIHRLQGDSVEGILRQYAEVFARALKLRYT